MVVTHTLLHEKYHTTNTPHIMSQNRYNNKQYIEDVRSVANIDLPWKKLYNSSVLISGATGLIGSALVDVLMYKNNEGLNCKVYALCRNLKKAESCFSNWLNNMLLAIKSSDVNLPLNPPDFDTIGFVLHLASNTHPVLYATDPIGTICTNVIGLKNMLDLSANKNVKRFLFTSSVEVYGENRGDIDYFDERYCGYIDSNTLRAGYPESKRCGEALCQAYSKQKGLDIVIGRVARSYGPTMSLNDSRAISQFIVKGSRNEDIVLKSEGKQLFSYAYVTDTVSGLLTILLAGKSGDAYNIADENSNISLRNLAEMIADYSGTNVIFDLPNSVEASGYSKTTKALLNGTKLKELGWKPFYRIETGIPRTIDILKYLN